METRESTITHLLQNAELNNVGERRGRDKDLACVDHFAELCDKAGIFPTERGLKCSLVLPLTREAKHIRLELTHHRPRRGVRTHRTHRRDAAREIIAGALQARSNGAELS
jgi:hypothetical protein